VRVVRNQLGLALRRKECAAGGFSLVEMLVTLVLMLIIFVILFGFSSRSHQQQQKAACARNLETLYVALEMFAREHAGAFPTISNAPTSDVPLSLLVPQYISTTEPFTCPGSKDDRVPEGEGIAGRRISYAYYMGRGIGDTNEVVMSDEQIDTGPKIQGRPVFSRTGKRPGNNHHRYGVNYLFCDGHTEASSATAPFSLVLPPGVVLLNPRKP